MQLLQHLEDLLSPSTRSYIIFSHLIIITRYSITSNNPRSIPRLTAQTHLDNYTGYVQVFLELSVGGQHHQAQCGSFPQAMEHRILSRERDGDVSQSAVPVRYTIHIHYTVKYSNVIKDSLCRWNNRR